MTPTEFGFLLVWGLSAMISFAIIGAGLRSEMDKMPEGGSINGDGYIFMCIVALFTGPFMAAFLIGLTMTSDKKAKNEPKNSQ